MERTVTLPTAELLQPAVQTWRAGARRVLPLWRHVVWLVALFVVLAAWVQIRVDVQAYRQDLDRNGRAMREASIRNDRLRLEVDARRRALAVEAVADAMTMGQDARLVRMHREGGRP